MKTITCDTTPKTGALKTWLADKSTGMFVICPKFIAKFIAPRAKGRLLDTMVDMVLAHDWRITVSTQPITGGKELFLRCGENYLRHMESAAGENWNVVFSRAIQILRRFEVVDKACRRITPTIVRLYILCEIL